MTCRTLEELPRSWVFEPTKCRGQAMGADYEISWAPPPVSRAGRWMPSFFIRLRRVLGCKLSNRAAPFAPSITHRDCSSTVRMCRRSISSSVAGDCVEEDLPAAANGTEALAAGMAVEAVILGSAEC